MSCLDMDKLFLRVAMMPCVPNVSAVSLRKLVEDLAGGEQCDIPVTLVAGIELSWEMKGATLPHEISQIMYTYVYCILV